MRFSVPVQVEFGQSVKVVGNHPALGSWDTDNGVELEWNDGNVWEKLVHISPGIYEFKVNVLLEFFLKENLVRRCEFQRVFKLGTWSKPRH